MTRRLMSLLVVCVVFGISASSLYGDPASITIGVSVGTGDATGAVVTYSVKSHTKPALDVTCTPEGGPAKQFSVSRHFPIGTTTISCSDTDGNAATRDVTIAGEPVTSTDPTTTASTTTTTETTTTPPITTTIPSNTTGPEFSDVPAPIQVEANGPAGSTVMYRPPTATDAIDGPVLVTCAPLSGSLFRLGTTTVSCSARDSDGNPSGVTFAVNVVDTTAPTLLVPAEASAFAENVDGLWANGYGAAQFLAAARTNDVVDPRPRLTSDAPARFSVGTHVVTFTATDASGNSVSKTAKLIVLPVASAGTPPRPVPPAPLAPPNVTNFKAAAGDRRVQLSWQRPSGVERVVITRALLAGGEAQEIYSGSGAAYLDRGVKNGIAYRYLAVSVNESGDRSAGVAAGALPKANLLRSPKDGARLRKPPKLVWVRNLEASFYNVQLYRGKAKILSIWPNKPSLLLKRTWKYQGRRHTLARGTYIWYVWPGFGGRARADYGDMMGSRSFRIVR